MFIIYYIYLHQKYTFVRMRQYNNTICIMSVHSLLLGGNFNFWSGASSSHT